MIWAILLIWVLLKNIDMTVITKWRALPSFRIRCTWSKWSSSMPCHCKPNTTVRETELQHTKPFLHKRKKIKQMGRSVGGKYFSPLEFKFPKLFYPIRLWMKFLPHHAWIEHNSSVVGKEYCPPFFLFLLLCWEIDTRCKNLARKTRFIKRNG